MSADESLRSLFGAEEWRTLQLTPFWVLRTMVGAEGEGEVEPAELAILETFLGNADSIQDALLAEVAESVAADSEAMRAAFAADSRRVEEAFPEVRALLDRRVERERADSFKEALLGLAYAIANAAGEGFLGMGDRVSKEEISAFHRLAELLGIPPRDVG